MTNEKEISNFLYELIKKTNDNKALAPALRAQIETHIRSFDPDQDNKTAKGVVIVAINPDGHVVAEGTCFENSALGGMRVDESQHRRALGRMKLDFAREHLNHFMTQRLDLHFASDYWEQATKNGYRAEIVKVGYPKDEI